MVALCLITCCPVICLLASDFNISWFNRTTRGDTFTFDSHISAYCCLSVGVGKSGDAWLLMKADEEENTAAAKHSGHFGCQLVHVTAFGSKSSLTIFLRFLSGSVTQDSSHNHWKCSYKMYDPVLHPQVSKLYQLINNQWHRPSETVTHK